MLNMFWSQGEKFLVTHQRSGLAQNSQASFHCWLCCSQILLLQSCLKRHMRCYLCFPAVSSNLIPEHSKQTSHAQLISFLKQEWASVVRKLRIMKWDLKLIWKWLDVFLYKMTPSIPALVVSHLVDISSAVLTTEVSVSVSVERKSNSYSGIIFAKVAVFC